MGTRESRGSAARAWFWPRSALAAKLTFANRNENSGEVILSGEEEGCQEEGHEEEGCEEEEVTILDLARPQGIGRRPVGQSPNDSRTRAIA